MNPWYWCDRGSAEKLSAGRSLHWAINMEFLVLMKLQDSGYGDNEQEKATILQDKIIPSLDMLINLEKEGMLTGGFFEGQRSAALFVTAEDEEKLDEALTQLPASEFFAIEILKLEGLKEARKRDEAILKGLQASMV
jgi:hypothetical protein